MKLAYRSPIDTSQREALLDEGRTLAGLADVYLDLLGLDSTLKPMHPITVEQRRELRMLVVEAVRIRSNLVENDPIPISPYAAFGIMSGGTIVCYFCRCSLLPRDWYGLAFMYWYGLAFMSLRQRAIVEHARQSTYYPRRSVEAILDDLRRRERRTAPTSRQKAAESFKANSSHATLCALRYLSSLAKGYGDPRELVGQRI